MKQKKHSIQKPLRVLTTSVVLGTTVFTSIGNMIHPMNVVHAQESVVTQNVSSTAVKTLEAPIVDAYRGSENGNYFIKGRGQANTKVVIKVQQQQFEGIVKADGTWEMEIPIRVKPREEFILTVVDTQGNRSKELKHIHKSGSIEFRIKDYGEISGWVTNIFEGKVKVTILNETYEGIIEDGNFSIKTPKIVVGTPVSVTVTGYKYSQVFSDYYAEDLTAPDAPKVNDLTDEDTKLNGTGEVNAKVTVQTATASYEGTINNEGNWSVPIPKQVENTKLQVIVTDDAKNKSKPTEVVVKSAKWNAPKLNKVGDGDTEISGTTEAGARVIAKVGDQSYEGISEANGNFSINIPKQVARTEIVVKMTKDGKESKESKEIVEDVTAPDAPKVNELTDEDTKLNGTGEANAKVTVQTATASYEGTIDSEGNWSVQIPKQVENEKLQVVVTDAAGNKSKSTEVIVKFSKWNAPKINKVGDSDTKISGTTEAGAKVVAKIGDKLYEGVAEADGKFSIDIPKQVAGTEIVVKMTKDEKESKESKEIVEDVTAPDAPHVNTISDKDVVVTGKGEVGATVHVQIRQEVYTGVVGTDGNFSVAIPKQEARTQISVKLVDSIGNKSKMTQVIVTAPSLEAPQVDEYYEEEFRITGKVKPGTNKIRLYVDGQLKRTGAIQKDGTFAIYAGDFHLSQGKEFKVVPVDINGKEGIAHTSIVQGKQGRFELSIDSYVKDAPHIRGMVSEDIKKVRLYLNGTYIRTGQINKDGTYTIYAKDQNIPDGSYFEVRGVDNQERERVKEKRLVSLGAPQVDGYHEGDLRITGKVKPSTKKIRLYVDGQLKRTGAIQADGTFAIYAGDFKLSQGKEFKVVSVDGNGAEGTAYIGTVQAMQGNYAVQANSYVLQDTYVRGTVSSDVKKVRLYIDGQLKRTGQINKDGTYLIYVKDQQISVDSEVEVRGVDHAEKERIKQKVEIKE
ncbi:Ig-like domain-containing protein [Bacillus toyonensis]|nr:Ig-like domain-containing protein [Bacillus toyonensis]MDT3495120.1 Ig-like domain-containing protein [Bacillus toyonensis]MDT3495433.1 Ig-like domain-containing protein [Bacillus toyonensis]MDT3495527.1 Ig-like domain-containing protein [Bacillus toyonensis]